MLRRYLLCLVAVRQRWTAIISVLPRIAARCAWRRNHRHFVAGRGQRLFHLTIDIGGRIDDSARAAQFGPAAAARRRRSRLLIEEVADHVVAVLRAGIDGVIIRPFTPEGGTIEDTIVTFGSKVWPRVMNSVG